MPVGSGIVSATFSTGSYCNAALDASLADATMCPPPSAPAATATLTNRYRSEADNCVRHLQHRQLLQRTSLGSSDRFLAVSATFSTGSYCNDLREVLTNGLA